MQYTFDAPELLPRNRHKDSETGQTDFNMLSVGMRTTLNSLADS